MTERKEQEPRVRTIAFRATDDEVDVLAQAAQMFSLPVSAFVRMIALEAARSRIASRGVPRGTSER